jgi:TctA family transporter
MAQIKHYAGEEIKDEWETYRQERRVDKKQADFGDGDIKTFAKVGAYPKGVALKKGEDPL